MDAHQLLIDLRARGIRLSPEGNIAVEPKELLSDADRAAIRQAKSELLQILMAETAFDESPALTNGGNVGAEVELTTLAEAGCVMLLADAIASAPRSPFLDDLAMARTVARFAVTTSRLARELIGDRLLDAQALCADTARAAANHIRRRDYLTAYELLDKLPVRLRQLMPQ